MSFTSSIESSPPTNEQYDGKQLKWVKIDGRSHDGDALPCLGFSFIYILKPLISNALLNAFSGLFCRNVKWIKVTGS